MVETSATAWFGLAGLMVLATLAGLSVARMVRWSEAAEGAGLRAAFAAGTAPLLLGLSAVVVLLVLPGASQGAHLFAVVLFLAVVSGAARLFRDPSRDNVSSRDPKRDFMSGVFTVLLLVWGVGLVFDTLFIPLTQNDSLEYATAARNLFEVRDLSAYPAIRPMDSTSGFFGPWTHPPLYPALIYLAYALQGHDHEPGLMRAIAPWALLAATYVVFTVGNLAGRRVGLISALTIISAPLLYLGAGSALIDPLAVLGLTVVLASVLGVESTAVRRGLIQGLALGLALWTHSQALLFPGLYGVAVVARHGLRHLGALSLQLSAAAGVTVAVAAFPYLRNTAIFGSPISDNPAVFAAPSLEWPEYFRLQRGLATVPDVLQYGLLKGWFAVEAYGAAFWLMTMGIILHYGLARRNSSASKWEPSCTGERWFFVSFCMVGFYMAGVLASIALGIDLMIRNERYWLVLMPCVAVLAGAGVGPLTQNRAGQGRFRRKLSAAVGAGLICLFAVQWIVVGGYRARSFLLGEELSLLSWQARLQKWPAYGAVEYLRVSTPSDALVLSLKPADMFYARRRMISYLDPRLLAFYAERDIERGYQALQDLSITHIHVPDYSIPPLYNSVLQDILSRPDLTKLAFEEGGYQIYELSPSAGAIEQQRAIGPSVLPWRRGRQVVVGGRKSLGRVDLSDVAPFSAGQVSEGPMFPLFQREQTTLLFSGRGDLRKPSPDGIPVRGGAEYTLATVLSGDAYAQIRILQYGGDQPLDLDQSLHAEAALAPRQQERRIVMRFRTKPGATSVRLIVEHRGQSWLKVHEARLALVTCTC
jgi:4-amino-4-deoxy-L-arabinose transferase-like glycosyltransferase